MPGPAVLSAFGNALRAAGWLGTRNWPSFCWRAAVASVCDDRTEVIDGKPIEVIWLPEREPREVAVRVRCGQFMVPSDNRDNTRDSRYNGVIPYASIVGVVSNLH
jgi:hypothetical protein